MLKILSTGDEDGTKQNINFAILLKIGFSFSFTLKKSNGPYLDSGKWIKNAFFQLFSHFLLDLIPVLTTKDRKIGSDRIFLAKLYQRQMSY